ncbi:hypothetical protein PLESTB_000507100 [Pleodorina starrii]|uniref:Uncharacterized protein n=1 Tax=Pleodorina starrii TaxID=330485 RepID=A0A9W6F0M1_9CHLO|nr:hypothetical protein PLESTB_000507100 [Pleodorina starrii]
MSEGRRVASAELECPGVQPHLGEQGRGAGYAHPERGLDRNSLRKGSLAPAEFMGTSQQFSSAPRKGETVDLSAGREFLSPRPISVRPSSNYGSGPPVVVGSHHATRALTRPPPSPSAPFGALPSPRTYQSNSYRDAALAAAQHGLSAYAQSAAAAAAAASRALTPRSGGGPAAGCGAATASPGRPPPAPRPTQHSAPTPMACPPNGAEFLPSCRAPSPSRGSMPPTRTGFLPSRGTAPPGPGSPGRGGGDGAAAAAAAATAAMASHRSGDLATVTVTHNDLWWRGAFDGSTEPDDPLAGGGGGNGSGPARPVSGSTAGAIRVMSPGWGAAPPSVFEADGRPGTRGGGPQYDMDGRPTTRGGQRPPSRAQLSLSQQRPPAHVSPLGPGWAGLFAGGCGTVSGEAASAAMTGAQYTPPRAPSAGACLSWSGDAAEQVGSHRRQLVPLPPTAVPAAVAARLGSPLSRCIGNCSVTGGALTVPPPPPSVGLSPASHGQPQGLQVPGQLPAPGGGGSSSNSSNSSSSGGGGGVATGSGRAQLGVKLSSIAEAPGSPILLPLPPQMQQQQRQQQQQQSKDSIGRVDSGGRKAPREREASFTSLVADPNALLSRISGGNSEEGVPDDSYLSNMDQDASNRSASGRARPRRNSASSPAAGGYLGHGPLSGDVAGGIVLGAAGSGSPTDENPSTRPRR